MYKGTRLQGVSEIALGAVREPSWQSTRIGLLVANAALLSSLILKVPRKLESKRKKGLLASNSIYLFFDSMHHGRYMYRVKRFYIPLTTLSKA